MDNNNNLFGTGEGIARSKIEKDFLADVEDIIKLQNAFAPKITEALTKDNILKAEIHARICNYLWNVGTGDLTKYLNNFIHLIKVIDCIKEQIKNYYPDSEAINAYLIQVEAVCSVEIKNRAVKYGQYLTKDQKLAIIHSLYQGNETIQINNVKIARDSYKRSEEIADAATLDTALIAITQAFLLDNTEAEKTPSSQQQELQWEPLWGSDQNTYFQQRRSNLLLEHIQKQIDSLKRNRTYFTQFHIHALYVLQTILDEQIKSDEQEPITLDLVAHIYSIIPPIYIEQHTVEARALFTSIIEIIDLSNVRLQPLEHFPYSDYAIIPILNKIISKVYRNSWEVPAVEILSNYLNNNMRSTAKTRKLYLDLINIDNITTKQNLLKENALRDATPYLPENLKGKFNIFGSYIKLQDEVFERLATNNPDLDNCLEALKILTPACIPNLILSADSDQYKEILSSSYTILCSILQEYLNIEYPAYSISTMCNKQNLDTLIEQNIGKIKNEGLLEQAQVLFTFCQSFKYSKFSDVMITRTSLDPLYEKAQILNINDDGPLRRWRYFIPLEFLGSVAVLSILIPTELNMIPSITSMYGTMIAGSIFALCSAIAIGLEKKRLGVGIAMLAIEGAGIAGISYVSFTYGAPYLAQTMLHSEEITAIIASVIFTISIAINIGLNFFIHKDRDKIVKPNPLDLT